MSVLHCDAVGVNVVQCGALWVIVVVFLGSMVQCGTGVCSVVQYGAVWCS